MNIIGVIIAATSLGSADVQQFPAFTCLDNGSFSGGPSSTMINREGFQALREVCAQNGPGRVDGVELYVDIDPNLRFGGVSTYHTVTSKEMRPFTRTVTDTIITKGTTDFSKGDVVGYAKNPSNGKSWAAWKNTMELNDDGWMSGTFTKTRPNGAKQTVEMSNRRLIKKCSKGVFNCNKVEYRDRTVKGEREVTVTSQEKRTRRISCNSTYHYALAYEGVVIGYENTGTPTCKLK